MHLVACAFATMAVATIAATPAYGAPEPLAPIGPEGRPWTSTDSAKIRYFLTRQSDNSWLPQAGKAAILPSDDGKYFFFVSYSGDLDRDCNLYTLSVYSVDAIANSFKNSGKSDVQAPTPARTTRLCDQGEAILDAHWGTHAGTVLFRGQNGDARQLYRLDIHSGRTVRLTDMPYGVATATEQGDSLVYGGVLRLEESADPRQYPIYVVTPNIVTRRLFPRDASGKPVLRATYKQGPPWQLSGRSAIGVRGPWFSPDARYAVMLTTRDEVPSEWDAYDGREAGARPSSVDFPEYVLIDFERGEDTPMLNAPTGFATRTGRRRNTVMSDPLPNALWSEDGKQVVVVNTTLPLTESAPERAHMAYVINYELEKRQWHVLEPLVDSSGRTVTAVGWLRPGKEILVQHERSGKPEPGTAYRLSHGRWMARPVDAMVRPAVPTKKRGELAHGVSVRLQQGANEPPRVIASFRGREMTLTKPDPALQGIWWAQRRAFEWTDSNGVVHTGGLLLPRNSTGSLPLVIQAASDVVDQFRPDGTYPTGYAAQSMVARGIAVLNLEAPSDPRAMNKPAELAQFVDWVESAADALAKQYPIDVTRVGMVGFSRNAFRTFYMITHPRRLRIAASVLADGITGSYLWNLEGYTLRDHDPISASRMYGGPFYEAKSSWLKEETTFNVDRVQGNTLFVGDEGLTALEMIGAFRAANRLLEFMSIPQAAHQLTRPRQREASLEATTDWMSFWLLGYEDPRPEKAARYKRWRELREQDQRRPRTLP